jgi:carbamoylphosphate synthase large subunit
MTVTSACLKSSLDCVAVKIPRWDLKKSSRVLQPLKQCEEHRRGEEKDIGRALEKTIRQLFV